MKKSTLVGLALSITLLCGCNSGTKVATVAQQLCDCYPTKQGATTALDDCFAEIVAPQLEEDWLGDEQTANLIELRNILSESCPSFSKLLLAQQQRANEYWRVLDKDSPSNLDEVDCRSLTIHENFYYREPAGDTTLLKIKNGIWLETLKDSTFSRLQFDWVTGCDFKITFIESNNSIKDKLSDPGDVYRYRVKDWDKEGQFYLIYSYFGDYVYETELYY